MSCNLSESLLFCNLSKFLFVRTQKEYFQCHHIPLNLARNRIAVLCVNKYIAIFSDVCAIFHNCCDKLHASCIVLLFIAVINCIHGSIILNGGYVNTFSAHLYMFVRAFKFNVNIYIYIYIWEKIELLLGCLFVNGFLIMPLGLESGIYIYVHIWVVHMYIYIYLRYISRYA